MINKRPKRKKKFFLKKKEVELVNNNITFEEVLVIDDEKKNLGVLPIGIALEKAKSLNLDLFCTNPKSKPPVCKILDYGKWKYHNNKKIKKIKLKQNVTQNLKQVRLKLSIAENDLNTKINKIKLFLNTNNNVKVSIRLIGREMKRLDIAKEFVDKLITSLIDVSKIFKEPKLIGVFYNFILSPK